MPNNGSDNSCAFEGGVAQHWGHDACYVATKLDSSVNHIDNCQEVSIQVHPCCAEIYENPFVKKEGT